MDAVELEERIRRLEARHGLVQPTSWPDPNRFATLEPWAEASRVAAAAPRDDRSPPSEEIHASVQP
jgi:hypothetical protein